MRVKVNEYEVVMEPTGRLHALRHGDEWRDCVGDQLVLVMAMEIERLREREQDLAEKCDLIETIARQAILTAYSYRDDNRSKEWLTAELGRLQDRIRKASKGEQT